MIQTEIYKRVIPVICDWDPQIIRAGLEQMRLWVKGSRADTVISAMDLLLDHGQFSEDSFTEALIEVWMLFLGFVIIAYSDSIDSDHAVAENAGEKEILCRLLDIAESADIPISIFAAFVNEAMQTHTRLMRGGISMN